MNPIATGTIPALNPDPAIMLIQREAGGPITYASINASPDEAIDMLRRALIHIVAGIHSLATVPTAAAITTNGHAPSYPSYSSDPSNTSNPIPPLRVPKTKPAGAPAPTRGKPGPKPGARRRKIDVEDDE